MYHCGYHGNLVTIAMRYAADAYHPREPPYQIRTQYDTRQSELLTYHCGCHGNLITITTTYVADAILPIAFKGKNVHFFNSNIDLKIDLQRT